MARWLKQSTAFTFRIGPFVDATDGVTAETGLTIAQADIQISKNGGAFAQTSASPTTTHDADGWYQCPLTATDTNTLGNLTVQIVMSGALMVWEHFVVVPAAVYDTLVAGIIPMQGNSTYGTMQSGSTSSNAVLASATSFVDDLVIGSTLVITGGTGAGQSRVIHDWVSSTDTASISPNWTTTPDNTSTYVVVPTPPAPTNAAALPNANVAAISGDTTAADNCEAFFDGTGYAGTGNVIPTVSSVTAVATGGITAGSIATDAIGAAELAADAVTEIVTGVWAAAARTLTALDEDSTTLDLDATIRAAVGLASANLDTQIAAVQSDTNDIQTRLPAALVSGRMDASVGAMAANVLTAAAIASNAFDADALATDAVTELATGVWASGTRTLTAGTNISIPTAAEIADAVWDESAAAHVVSGSTGEALGAAGAAGDPWTTTLPGAYSLGQAGYIIGNNVNATVSSRASQTSVDAVQTKTDQLTFTKANELDANIQSVNGATVTGNGNSQSWSGE